MRMRAWSSDVCSSVLLRGNDSSVAGVGIDNVVDGQGYSRRGWRLLLPWLRWGTVAFLLSLLVLDFAFPPKLPEARDTSTVVVARDGTPLRAFADAKGVWRYPADPDAVSSLYLQTLLNYADRWFWHHPGVNPLSLLRATWQMLRSEEHTSDLQSILCT